MMKNREGFTLVELVVVIVLAAIIMGGAYQSLITQGRAHTRTTEVIRGQDALRAALGILESELREAATTGDVAIIGLRDIVRAVPDSLTVRAPRAVGFVCEIHNNDKFVMVWTLGERDRFALGDGAFLFVQAGPTVTQDHWRAGLVEQVQNSSVNCPTRPAGTNGAVQRLKIAGLGGGAGFGGGSVDLAPIQIGAPVRGFNQVTYSLFEDGDTWFLGRHRGPNTEPDTLIYGLAGPGEGLSFSYLGSDGDPLTADPVPPDAVAGVRITARTGPREGTGASPVTVTSDIYFRNN
jgi:prepilin-type N-terminal cleavage/methylation domain-containing protein